MGVRGGGGKTAGGAEVSTIARVGVGVLGVRWKWEDGRRGRSEYRHRSGVGGGGKTAGAEVSTGVEVGRRQEG